MSWFLLVLLAVWLLCSLIIFISDFFVDGLEEDTVFDNLVYYLVWVPILSFFDVISKIIFAIRKRIQ